MPLALRGFASVRSPVAIPCLVSGVGPKYWLDPEVQVAESRPRSSDALLKRRERRHLEGAWNASHTAMGRKQAHYPRT